MSWLRYNLRYFGNPPWDTGVTPPEVMGFIQTHTPGRALDLGCGSGTNVLSLARAGWQVTGVDFAIKAADQARRRLKLAGVSGIIMQRDVTDLDDQSGGFDLILDIGCYHSLPGDKKAQYEANLKRLLAKQGWFLLYGMIHNAEHSIGLTEEDIGRLSDCMWLKCRQDGFDRGIRQSVWLTFQAARD
jgi:SAM-dependent methyltransferase